jgi:hypothetical protein
LLTKHIEVLSIAMYSQQLNQNVSSRRGESRTAVTAAEGGGLEMDTTKSKRGPKTVEGRARIGIGARGREAAREMAMRVLAAAPVETIRAVGVPMIEREDGSRVVVVAQGDGSDLFVHVGADGSVTTTVNAA